ncbi:hypothetical protein [Photobacterium halotolerans]|uniref:hypothetical protein n=2 Tax=Photobacterium TaxID=657 RepID=UPI001929BE3B|nr:hypothetical protein [Photobacterium halotolerans]
MPIAYHKNKEINAAIAYAVSNGWTYIKRKGKGHAVAILRCGNENKCHQKSVWGTPDSPQDHAKDIISLVDKCK